MSSVSILEREKEQVVYPAYDYVQVLMVALSDPQSWKRKKEECKKVERAYRELGRLLRDPSNQKLIAAWFGDDTQASEILQWMEDVRKKVGEIIPR
ncbi:hypothetical protein COU77_00390 [Candidatus Peregrinibacteria bacterium CG10_big_fil_rev_8_21_14_0_10_49_16]|nr:MAG: hypothetical protein COW95_04325 [Candidatus Peregrinibacteria bacterium CG22_combo_CG10-13_8_21_14_all_49_11]PIR52444.1 MAG: hypothetical protein COU77_00390 [Candidatus Peregrinibacteria bacterium CG10_big_fil_rev_8_21_14_0_10_49_16]